MLCYLKLSRVLFVMGLFLTLFISCGGDNQDDDLIVIPPVQEKIIPSNLTLTITVVGADDGNPNGDGTGVIKCEASATDAVKYEFRFGGGVVVENTTGKTEHTYTNEGTNNYTVYVYAYSNTNDNISTSDDVTVFVIPVSYNTLIFSDEFDTETATGPDDVNWNYDIGTGNWGWGNNEAQYYTKRPENVIVEDGLLKIIAKKENYEGAEYTSARMKTQGKFDFTYGKVEVRAKLPQGGGTWPAIWMLGSNISNLGWPACGEIDIMEHAGNRQGIVQSALHTTSSNGDTKNKGFQTLADVSTAFHIYAVEWTSEKMVFSVDGIVHYTYNPATKNSSTWPFDANQFLILNVAMGGSFGGTIDANFTQSSMEIDYVRVYK